MNWGFIIFISCLATAWGALPYVSGPLEGLTCDSEAVQSTISGQFNSILSELTDTTFFRLVRSEDGGECPIDSLQPKDDVPTCGAVGDAFPSPFSSPFGEPSSSAATPGFGSPEVDGEGEGSLCSVEPAAVQQRFAETIVTSISPEEATAQNEFPRDNDCVIEGTNQIRPDYWLDICNTAPSGNYEYINLKLNPERNTGYNGLTIWEYMHDTIGSLDSEEGIILQRLISGYHTATTTQIARSYYPPPRRSANAAGVHIGICHYILQVYASIRYYKRSK